MATKSSGFTLIELLVVVGIIGILSTIGVVAYQGYVTSAKINSTKTVMQQIGLMQTEYLSSMVIKVLKKLQIEWKLKFH